MSIAIEKFEAAKKKIDEARAEAKAVAKESFADLSKALFDEHPTLEKFGWNQYTPYFNDGDECVFSARIDDPDINGVDGYEISKAFSTYPASHPELLPLKASVAKFLKTFGDDTLKEMFGDHQQITVSRDGTVDADDYEHD